MSCGAVCPVSRPLRKVPKIESCTFWIQRNFLGREGFSALWLKPVAFSGLVKPLQVVGDDRYALILLWLAHMGAPSWSYAQRLGQLQADPFSALLAWSLTCPPCAWPRLVPIFYLCFFIPTKVAISPSACRRSPRSRRSQVRLRKPHTPIFEKLEKPPRATHRKHVEQTGQDGELLPSTASRLRR